MLARTPPRMSTASGGAAGAAGGAAAASSSAELTHTSSFRQRGESIDEYEERLCEMAAALEAETVDDAADADGADSVALLAALPPPPGTEAAASNGSRLRGRLTRHQQSEGELRARLEWLKQLDREDGSPLTRSPVPSQIAAWRERARQTARTAQKTRQSSPLDLVTAGSATSDDENDEEEAELERRYARLQQLHRDETTDAAAAVGDSTVDREKTVRTLMLLMIIREGGIALRLATELEIWIRAFAGNHAAQASAQAAAASAAAIVAFICNPLVGAVSDAVGRRPPSEFTSNLPLLVIYVYNLTDCLRL